MTTSKFNEFPIELVTEALKAKGGTGQIGTSAYNDLTDEQLVQQVLRATSLYPALRSMAYRLPSRRTSEGKPLTRDEQVQILHKLMHNSIAAEPDHSRHEDWLDRLEKIEELVDSSIETHAAPEIDEAGLAAILAEGPPLMKVAIDSRPIGPQRETKASDIEKRVAFRKPKPSTGTTTSGKGKQVIGDATVTLLDSAAYFDVHARGLAAEIIPPISWIIPLMIPKQGVLSVAGPSNVGKTRFIAALLGALAVGRTERLGLPPCEKPFITLWVANEERGDDIRRRVKAVFRQHGDKKSATIRVRAKDNGMMRLVALNEVGNPEIDEEAVAELVEAIRDAGAEVVVFDPYVTLSDAIDENSAASASVLTKAFLLIAELTGAAVLHVHHTPKNREKDNDVIRGNADGWRGSSAIYSALDCGFTLANWMPKNGEQRKAWKQSYLEGRLSRWVVLDTAKIREGEQLEPVVLELVGQEMDEGEGLPIGVCRLSSASEAENSLVEVSATSLSASILAATLLEKLGEGRHDKLDDIHKAMAGDPGWPAGKRLQGRDLERICDGIFTRKAIRADAEYGVKFECDKGRKTNRRWTIVIEKTGHDIE
jgi:hypothetical protein